MKTLTIHPQTNEQLEAIISVLKALKIPFENKGKTYNTEFVKKIYAAEEQPEGTIILNNTHDIDNYFDNLPMNVQD